MSNDIFMPGESMRWSFWLYEGHMHGCPERWFWCGQGDQHGPYATRDEALNNLRETVRHLEICPETSDKYIEYEQILKLKD